VGSAGWFWKHHALIAPVPPHVRVDRLLSYGTIATLGGVMNALLFSPARLMTHRLLDPASVGVLSAYQAGSIQMGLMLLAATGQVFFPVASRTPDKHALLLKIIRLYALSALPLALLLGATLWMYFTVLGRHYPLQWLEGSTFTISAVLSTYQGFLIWLLASQGRRGMLAGSLTGILAGGVNIAACHGLIPVHGIQGAAEANLLASAVGIAAGFAVAFKIFKPVHRGPADQTRTQEL